MQDPSQEAWLSGHPDAQALLAYPELCRTHQPNSREPMSHPGPRVPRELSHLRLCISYLLDGAILHIRYFNTVSGFPALTWLLWGLLGYRTAVRIK